MKNKEERENRDQNRKTKRGRRKKSLVEKRLLSKKVVESQLNQENPVQEGLGPITSQHRPQKTFRELQKRRKQERKKPK